MWYPASQSFHLGHVNNCQRTMRVQIAGSMNSFLYRRVDSIYRWYKVFMVYVSVSPNPMVLGCIAGSALLRKAASLAFVHKKRATLTTDIIEFLGTSLEEIYGESRVTS
ncbi:hypothetical protein Taro_005918 [Colocasia esculenta]|uniref:Uncharacterized protein n=1 Tax=Colocasia esculenta TaxID=4460 RepID=A0A843TR67_COLES|nr:hypothetical protein [Colocasia esculenta]